MSAILKFDIQKKKTITFFWSKLSKLHKKTQFCMWQLHFPLNNGKQEQAVDSHPPPPALKVPFAVTGSHIEISGRIKKKLVFTEY